MEKEIVVENSVLSILKELEYEHIDKDNNEWLRERNLDQFINEDLLKKQLIKINGNHNKNVIDEVIRKIKYFNNPDLFERNKLFSKYLTNGINVDDYESEVNPLVKLIDFENIENNIFQVCQQIEFKENRSKRIPDVVVFINGIPLVVMELKTYDEESKDAILEKAFLQLGSDSKNSGYRYDIETLFIYNAFLVISDGATVKFGTLTSGLKRFNEWKSIDGNYAYENDYAYKLQTNIKGVFEKNRFLDIIKNFIFFKNDSNDSPTKIMAQYHQYFGVKKALNSILKSLKPNGDGKAGIVWHTQGSGKSFTMAMLSHSLLTMHNSELGIPTIVILTDRIDLDNQLFKTFSTISKDYLKFESYCIESRKDLIDKLSTLEQGGIFFTTINKFDKENIVENNRKNIIVIADEAHRSHYGINQTTKYKQNENDEYEALYSYGIEKYIRDSLPNATFIGFTGTPISTKQKRTTDIFGEVIDTYDMTQSIYDGSTVKLYYEPRHIKLELDNEKIININKYYHEIEKSNQSSDLSIERSKVEMSKLKVILEDDNFIGVLADDIINHYEKRKDFLNGKAMIVCPTRKAALKLFKKLKEKYDELVILVVTESNKDSQEEREYFKDKNYRKDLGDEFKKVNSKYKIAIVVDMWLTGFDVPDLDVIYFVKRMKSYALMQAIARVNRVFPNKDYGLIVDYIDINNFLQESLREYTKRDSKGNLQSIDLEICKVIKEKIENLNEKFKDIDKSNFNPLNLSSTRFFAVQDGANFVLKDVEFEKEFKSITLIIKTALTVTSGSLNDEELNDANYYLAIRSFIYKIQHDNEIVNTSEMNKHVNKLLKDAFKINEVQVLNSNENNANPSAINLLSEEKIKQLKDENPPYVLIELLKKILKISIVNCKKTNIIKFREYSERLEQILEDFNSRSLNFNPDKTIVNFVELANKINTYVETSNALNFDERERAFYDILISQDIKTLINDKVLKKIALEIDESIEENLNLPDWHLKKSQMNSIKDKIKECLKKYNYPPNFIGKTTDDLMEQIKTYGDTLN